ncbi:MAG: penicillin acylase family protein [Gammaproteobacteria bacterium]|nr:penicillin acylase family protein [Gammaproteobacteria bacterium]MDH5303484.1 penicillin acylase family protein [Gammaproteobacteria bacterium]MDH5321513.1 penicillin acylase family protein [Gammaproteobacteria bacterium]
MRRWAGRLLFGLFSAASMVAMLAWLTLRASLPQLDGELEAAELSAAASIVRDAAGIPTIRASNRLDLAFATGFVHGQDRYFQMDLLRRDAAGELSALIGAATIDADRRKRLHRFRSRTAVALQALTENERALLERYAAGVNAGLASLDAKPFEYYLLGVDPEPWIAADSLLVAYAMFFDLNDELARRDVQRGLAAKILPAEVFAWMYPPGTSWDAPMMGEARAPLPIPPADVYSLRSVSPRASSMSESGSPPLPGSNNWAVSGALTESGLPIVSNDMHLGLRVPNIYYRARLVSSGTPAVDISGVTLPGQPLVIAGSSGRVAWGFTNSYGDWSDAILLLPGRSPQTYQTPDGDQAYQSFEEIIVVKGAEPVTLKVRETIWGPVADGLAYPDGEIAISWIAHHTSETNLRLIELETAATVDEALSIANHVTIPPQNFVVGDSGGNIGWTIAGPIPVRVGYDPLLPADWSQVQGWQGWLPAESYPRIINPESGRIWTANARVADGEALRLIGNGGYDLGARAAQIRDALLAKNQFAVQDMLDIQFDDRALFLGPWQALLLEVLGDAEEFAEYRQLVEAWVPRAAAESVGYRLVRSFRLEVRQRVFDALMTPVREAYGDDVRLRISNQFEAPLWALLTERPKHMLPAGFDDWNEFLLAAVRANINYFEENFDGPLASRTWGEFNTAIIQHPLSRAIPLLSRWLDMPATPMHGDENLPRAQGPTFGASERFSVYPGNEAESLMHMPGGQSGHPLSLFYRQGHDAWVEGRATPFLPGASQHELILRPATR